MDLLFESIVRPQAHEHTFVTTVRQNKQHCHVPISRYNVEYHNACEVTAVII